MITLMVLDYFFFSSFFFTGKSKAYEKEGIKMMHATHIQHEGHEQRGQ